MGYQDRTCWSWHPSLLPGSYVVSYFDSTFLPWVVYLGYTRPRGCLLSARLTQVWPRTVTVTGHEERVKQKNLSFNLVKVPYPAIFMLYFFYWVPKLSSAVSVLPLWFIFTILFRDFISAKAGYILIKIRLLMSSGCIEEGNCSYLRL